MSKFSLNTSYTNYQQCRVFDTAISDKDPMTCQPTVTNAKFQQQDIHKFDGLVQLIANEMDLKSMGEYHVGHGDCTHWIQPSIPDTFPAQLSDLLVERMPRHQNGCGETGSHHLVLVVGVLLVASCLAYKLGIRTSI
jgi:hypothetical protein